MMQATNVKFTPRQRAFASSLQPLARHMLLLFINLWNVGSVLGSIEG